MTRYTIKVNCFNALKCSLYINHSPVQQWIWFLSNVIVDISRGWRKLALIMQMSSPQQINSQHMITAYLNRGMRVNHLFARHFGTTINTQKSYPATKQESLLKPLYTSQVKKTKIPINTIPETPSTPHAHTTWPPLACPKTTLGTRHNTMYSNIHTPSFYINIYNFSVTAAYICNPWRSLWISQAEE